MSREFGWDVSARRYAALYRKVAPQAPLLEIERRAAKVRGTDFPQRRPQESPVAITKRPACAETAEQCVFA
jgi:hypothetical protein